MTELEQKQKAIIDHYGVDKQLDMLVEECAELIQAIQKYKRYNTEEKDYNSVEYGWHIMLEMADVENLIEQFKLSNEELAEDIGINKKNKVERQLRRIADEQEIAHL